MEKETIIKVEHLAKSFGSFQAVKDVSFTVSRGDVFGFLGPNGAGKSTTIRCLLSLIKPDAGNIELFGKSYRNSRSEILSKIGSIIEKPDFYKYLSAQKNLEIFARISGASVSKSQIGEMLEFVGLAGRGGDKIGGFSHGMKQRLGIAQTLLHDPDLIVLDEPTTGLDPQGIIDIRNLILNLKNEFQKTIVLSSHILSEIELIANRMVIINKGNSLVEGSVQALLNQEDLLVLFEVADSKAALNILSAYKNVQITDSQHFEISLGKNEIPECIAKLQQAGILVYGVETKRKLEDYF